MMSTQYKVDIQRAAEEAALHLTQKFKLAGDGKDAWIFDVDDTLLSTVPYYKKHPYGGDALNQSSIESWMLECKATAVEHMLDLYEDIKARGLKIFLLSSRGEYLREATVDNLIKAGYRGWSELILRCSDDRSDTVQGYKAKQRKELVNRGYRIWGVIGDQWSSIVGGSIGIRTFKLPNPMYYVN